MLYECGFERLRTPPAAATRPPGPPETVGFEVGTRRAPASPVAARRICPSLASRATPLRRSSSLPSFCEHSPCVCVQLTDRSMGQAEWSGSCSEETITGAWPVNYKVCSSCGKHVRDTESHCWNCQSVEFIGTATPGAVPETNGSTLAVLAADRPKKKCAFCAEEIQDAAIVCKHCGRNLIPVAPKPVAPRKTSGLVQIVAIILGLLLVLFIVSMFTNNPSTNSNGTPLLNISAGKGPFACSIMNREPSPLTKCDLTITDPDAMQWTANLLGPIGHLESVSVPWSAFQAQGHPMPNYLRDRGVIVSCWVEGLNARRSAGFR